MLIVGCVVLLVSGYLLAGPVVDVVVNGDFDLMPKDWSNNHLPGGWVAWSPAAENQLLARTSGKDDLGAALRLAKTGDGRGGYRRIVQQLRGIMIPAGAEITIEVDAMASIVPAGSCLSVGLSKTGGNRRNWQGDNDFVDGARIELNSNTLSPGQWKAHRVTFTATEDIYEPFVLLAETHWVDYPYDLTVDNVRVLVPAVKIAEKAGGRIIIASDAPHMVRYAAEELRDYLSKITGGEYQILSSDQAGDSLESMTFLLGAGPHTAEYTEQVASLGSDGFVTDVQPGRIVIIGRDDPVPFLEKDMEGIEGSSNGQPSTISGLSKYGQTGTLFGVYDFLRRHADAMWAWPGELGESYRTGAILAPVGLRTNQPDFAQRIISYRPFDEPTMRWYRRAGYGSPLDPHWPNHSASRIATQENFQKHPEWFAIQNGRRNPSNLSWAHPAIATEYTRLASEHFRKYPDSKVYRVMPADGTGISNDPYTAPKVNWEKPGTGEGPLGGNALISNVVWPTVNAVAREVGREFPDRYVGCCAYATYLKPPYEIEKLEPNVMVMLCSMTPLMWPASQYGPGIEAFERGWQLRQPGLLAVWDYFIHRFQTGNNGDFIPWVVPNLISQRYGRLKGKCFGAFVQSSFYGKRTAHWGKDHVNWMVMSRVFWQPDRDIELLLDQYCKAFYGPAAETMRTFWLVQQQAWCGRTDEFSWSGLTIRWNHVYTNEVLARMFSLLDTARRESAAWDNPMGVARINFIAREYAALHRCLPAEWTAPQTWTIPNGSFESASDGRPEGWGVGPGASVVDHDAFDGRKCLQLVGRAWAVSAPIKMVDGRHYFVSAWFRTSGSGEPDLAQACPLLSVSGVKTMVRAAPDSPWARMFVLLTKTPRMTDTRVWINGGTGFETRIDAVTVEEISDEEFEALQGSVASPTEKE